MTEKLIQTTGTPSSEGVPVRLCTKCKLNHRPNNSAWCRDCRNEQAAEYRARMRKKVVKEMRTCAWGDCDKEFEWRSSYPKQVCCCRSHYQSYAWRLKNPRKAIEELPEGQKKCSKCAEVKGISDFPPSLRELSWGQCSTCRRDYEKEWTSRNTDKRSASSRRSRRKRLLKKYGAPSDDFDLLLEQQGGVCGCCGGPKGQKEWHIDHDHNKLESESYRGLLCHGCNVGLGAFRDDPALLESAIRYLTSTTVVL